MNSSAYGLHNKEERFSASVLPVWSDRMCLSICISAVEPKEELGTLQFYHSYYGTVRSNV